MRRFGWWFAGVVAGTVACVDVSNLVGGSPGTTDAGEDVAVAVSDGGTPVGDSAGEVGATCDCASANCGGGSCPIADVASAKSNPDSLVVDDLYVYWVEHSANGAVRKAPITTLGSPTDIASGQANPIAVALFAGSPVWTTGDDDGLNTANVADGGVSRIGSAPGITWLAPANGTLYAAHRNSSTAAFGAISACKLAGCTVSNVLYEFEGSVIEQLRAIPGRLAWVLSATTLRTCAFGTCSAPGGASTRLEYPEGIAAFDADSDFIYVAKRGGAGGIHALAVSADAGAPLIPILSPLEGISSIVVDGNAIYYASQTAGVVGRVPRTGGAPTILASGGQPKSVAVHGGYVYWIDGASFTIRRTAR